MTTDLLPKISADLKARGFTALRNRGDPCACRIDHLAPCGEYHQDPDKCWINGCEPAYAHDDPSGRTNEWVVSWNPATLTQEQFDRAPPLFLE